MIRAGQTVSIEYTLTLDNGETADSNVGGEPLAYEHGADQILPGLERELAELEAGDEKQVTLTPEDGYGVHDPEGLQTVPIAELPEDARAVGTQLVSQDPEGNQFPVRIHAIEGDNAVLDFNHPLAGETLHFAVKVLEVS